MVKFYCQNTDCENNEDKDTGPVLINFNNMEISIRLCKDCEELLAQI